MGMQFSGPAGCAFWRGLDIKEETTFSYALSDIDCRADRLCMAVWGRRPFEQPSCCQRCGYPVLMHWLDVERHLATIWEKIPVMVQSHKKSQSWSKFS